MNRSRVIVALDTADLSSAARVVDKLQGKACWFKVGMEIFYASGWQAVELVKSSGAKVFLDLKFNDIPNTVAGAFRSCLMHGVDMINMHTTAGASAMQQAAAEVAKLEPHARPITLGVTVLTSIDGHALNEQIGIPGSVMESVVRLSLLAKQSGLDGVVASPLEVEAIKQAAGTDIVVVTPGVRPEWSAAGDQKRFTTPRQAFSSGADYIVVGRPITAAADPLSAFERLCEEIEWR